MSDIQIQNIYTLKTLEFILISRYVIETWNYKNVDH